MTAINDNGDEAAMKCPTWPTEPPTAAELIRYSAGRGYWLMGRTFGLMDREHADHGPTPQTMAQHMAWTVEMIHHHDAVLLLKALAEHDPAEADALSARLWTAADAGDSYGEWLWQWAKEAGLDPDAIYADGEASGFDNGHAIAPSPAQENGSSTPTSDDT